MSRAVFTCKNHPELRWDTKWEAVTKCGSYTGARHIFFQGGWKTSECACPASDLVLAPECPPRPADYD